MFQDFIANKLDSDTNQVMTARGGKFHEGYTVINIRDIVEGVEGRDALLDANLKTLVGFKDQLKEGKQVNVHVSWNLTDDGMEYKDVALKHVAVADGD